MENRSERTISDETATAARNGPENTPLPDGLAVCLDICHEMY